MNPKFTETAVRLQEKLFITTPQAIGAIWVVGKELYGQTNLSLPLSLQKQHQKDISFRKRLSAENTKMLNLKKSPVPTSPTKMLDPPFYGFTSPCKTNVLDITVKEQELLVKSMDDDLSSDPVHHIYGFVMETICAAVDRVENKKCDPVQDVLEKGEIEEEEIIENTFVEVDLEEYSEDSEKEEKLDAIEKIDDSLKKVESRITAQKNNKTFQLMEPKVVR